MDSTTLLLIAVPLVLGVIFNAVRFMRFIGFLASAGRRASPGGHADSLMSFDERLAERLRQLERETPRSDEPKPAPPAAQGFGRRQN